MFDALGFRLQGSGLGVEGIRLKFEDAMLRVKAYCRAVGSRKVRSQITKFEAGGIASQADNLLKNVGFSHRD